MGLAAWAAATRMTATRSAGRATPILRTGSSCGVRSGTNIRIAALRARTAAPATAAPGPSGAPSDQTPPRTVMQQSPKRIVTERSGAGPGTPAAPRTRKPAAPTSQQAPAARIQTFRQASRWLSALPVHPFPQRRHVRGVMPAMPGVEAEHAVESDPAVVGVEKRTLEVLRGHRPQHGVPAVVERLEEKQRHFDRRSPRVGELGPAVLFIRLDRRLVLGQRQLEADVGVHMAVRHVVDDLPDGP